MNYEIKGKEIVLRDADIDLRKTFDCGQCFRFEEVEEGSFEGVAYGKIFRARAFKGDIAIETTEADFLEFWNDFLDLDGDYAGIMKGFEFDKTLTEAMRVGEGIHILKQEPWEALCSFIISQNNNIPRIKKIIKALCALLGDEISEGVYSFPSSERVAEAGAAALEPIRSGFRAKYIIDAAEKVASGKLRLEALRNLNYDEALRELMTVKGVGLKVASCTALFSLGFTEAFPIDVWVRRIIDSYYGEGFSPEVFGKYAGIAQQYLFYYERERARGR